MGFQPHNAGGSTSFPLNLHRPRRRRSTRRRIFLQLFEQDLDLNLNSTYFTNGIPNDASLEEEMVDHDQIAFCAVNLDDISRPFISRLDSKSTFIEFTDDGVCIPAGPTGQWKERTANFLREPSVEIVIAFVVVLNSILVALSTLDRLEPYMPQFRMAENLVAVIFIIDFVGRWFSSCREVGRFVLDPQFVVDVMVVILPFVVTLTPTNFWEDVAFLPSALTRPSGLFNLQLLRVLRLRRFLRDLDTFERFCDRALGNISVGRFSVQEWQLQLARVLLSLFTLLSVSSGLIYTCEEQVNPSIDSYFDALYFGLTTLTTVGLGDVSPITWQGKLVVCGSILLGIAVVPSQAAALVEALLDREQVKNGGKSRIRKTRAGVAEQQSNMLSTSSSDEMMALDTAMQCPECGAAFHWASAQYCYSCGEEL